MAKPLMHDPGRADELKRRVSAITPDMKPRWGKMSVDQMLHHCNYVLAESLGEYKAKRSIKGIPRVLVRWAIIEGPWGKGAPTRPDMYIPQGERYDFAQEKARMLSMIDRVLARPMNEPWPEAANFPMTGRHWSKLNYKHLNHHLTQFGV